MRDYTTIGLIEEIKRRGSFPSDEQLNTQTGYLAFADEEMQGYIVPRIMEVREEYFVTYKDIPLEDNKQMYQIPEKAIGMKVRDATLVDSSGDERNLPRFRQEFRVSVDVFSGQTGFPQAHFFRGDQIGIYPTPNTSDQTLRVYYFRRPSELVEPRDAAQITSIDTVNNIVSCQSVPTTITSGTTIDIINGRPGFNAKYDEVQVVTRSGSDIELNDVTNIDIGDWIAHEGQSPIPQLPPEAHRALAQDVVARVMEALGDNDGYKIATQRFEKLFYHFMTTITPRNEGEVEKVIGSDSLSRHANDIMYYWG